jgi:hypothetical protein
MKTLRWICVVMVFGICAAISSTSGAADKKDAAGAKTAQTQKPVTGAADIKDTARAKMVQIQKAIVTVRTVVKIKIPGMRGAQMPTSPGSEMKSEAIGAVIDSDGLTITDMSASSSLASMYESEMMGGMDYMPGMGSMRGGMPGSMPGRAKPQIIKETSIILEDGTEMPADIVLKDEDLGFAFVRPRDASRKLEAIELKPSSQQPKLLDSIFTIGRLGNNDGRALTLSLDSIRAVVTKGSNSYYISEKGTPGCIAFSANGLPIGIYVMKEQEKGSDEGNYNPMEDYMSEMMGSEKATIIRSINDVVEAVQKTKKGKTSEEVKPPKEK